jgi:hypothetical protein
VNQAAHKRHRSEMQEFLDAFARATEKQSSWCKDSVRMLQILRRS